MSNNLLILFILAMVLMIMQSIGGFIQIRGYRKAISRMHKLGNVGIGQKRGRMFNGYIAIVACDSQHRITGIEAFDGKTILAHFHPVDELLGKSVKGISIETFLEEFRAMEPKKQKRYRGYIDALEALEMRFNREIEEAQADEAKADEPGQDLLDAES